MRDGSPKTLGELAFADYVKKNINVTMTGTATGTIDVSNNIGSVTEQFITGSSPEWAEDEDYDWDEDDDY
jgi:hypothetical protein